MLQLLSLTKRERYILIAIAAILLVFFCFIFLFAPLADKIASLNKEIESKELKLKKNQKILSQERKVAEDYKKYEQYLRQAGSDEQEMASLLAEIETIGRTVNIRINDMKPRKAKRVDFYNSFAVEIESEGSLQDIAKFMYSLQSPPHLLKVERARLEKQVSFSTAPLKGYLLVTKILIPQ